MTWPSSCLCGERAHITGEQDEAGTVSVIVHCGDWTKHPLGTYAFEKLEDAIAAWNRGERFPMRLVVPSAT